MEGSFCGGSRDWTLEMVGREERWVVRWVEEYSTELVTATFYERVKAFAFKNWLMNAGYHVTVDRVSS